MALGPTDIIPFYSTKFMEIHKGGAGGPIDAHLKYYINPVLGREEPHSIVILFNEKLGTELHREVWDPNIGWLTHTKWFSDIELKECISKMISNLEKGSNAPAKVLEALKQHSTQVSH